MRRIEVRIEPHLGAPLIQVIRGEHAGRVGDHHATPAIDHVSKRHSRAELRDGRLSAMSRVTSVCRRRRNIGSITPHDGHALSNELTGSPQDRQVTTVTDLERTSRSRTAFHRYLLSCVYDLMPRTTALAALSHGLVPPPSETT